MPRFISTTLTQLIIVSCTLLMASKALAEAPRWYEVEVALIGYQDSQKISHENWPEILINELPNDETSLEINPQDTFKVDPWSWLTWWNNKDESEYQLYNVQGLQASSIKPVPDLEVPFTEKGIAFEDKVEKFKKTKGLQIIWSKKWQQPIPEKEGASQEENAVNIDFRVPLNFQQAQKTNTPLLEAEVTGNIHLYRSRYLHLVSNLNIQHWQNLDNNKSLDQSIDALPNHSNEGLNIIPSKSSTPLTAINEVPLRAARVIQSRRMRSNELHYIDHPLLGILVRVVPLAEVAK